MRVLSGLALDRATHKKDSQRAVGYRHARRIGQCKIAQWDAGASEPIKTGPRTTRGHEVQISDEIAVSKASWMSL
jgi:hypothetical protein